MKKEEVVQRTQLDNKSPIQVHHDEGVANRIDPKSCADAREGIGEALTGERTGQPLSRGAPGDRQEVDGASPSR